MVKLLTRRDLWIALVFSLLLWFGLPLIGASDRFSMAFAALILLLSVLTLALAETDNQPPDQEGDEESAAEDEGESLYSVLASQNETQRQIQEELSALRRDIKSIKASPGAAAADNAPAAEVPAKLGELSGALSEAMKQISVRDSQIDILATNVNRANIQRNLVRLTQSLEVALSLKARVDSGLSNAKDSFDFLVDDMNSALTDQGVESMEIAVGARVADLPAGSFAAISVVDAPQD